MADEISTSEPMKQGQWYAIRTTTGPEGITQTVIPVDDPLKNEWTKETPTEPGWYRWWNEDETVEPGIFLVTIEPNDSTEQFSAWLEGRFYGYCLSLGGWWKRIDMTPPSV